ncbi:MAG: glycosyltransferase [bacterium]|nr:glycosyltransferase [bacterium]
MRRGTRSRPQGACPAGASVAHFLILNHNVHGHGTFIRCYNIGRQCTARGHAVTLVTVSPRRRVIPEVTVKSGIRIIQTPACLGGYYQGGGWGLADMAARLTRLLFGRFDIVYAFDHRPNVALPALCQRYLKGVPLVTDWADWWCGGGHLDYAKNFPLQYGVERFLESDAKRLSDAVTVISTALYGRARRLGIPAQRLLHLPSGADVETIVPLDRMTMRDRHSIPRDMKVVGYLSASLVDADMLMRCMAMVFSRRRDVGLLFIGPDEGWHRAMAREMGLDGRIIWTGFQPYEKVGEYLACADVMLLPMRDNPINEGRWPNRIGEHIAAGRATAACAVGEMKTLFKRAPLGILARPEESDLVDKLIYLLDRPEMADELGAAARRFAEQELSWNALGGRLLEFVRRTTGVA